MFEARIVEGIMHFWARKGELVVELSKQMASALCVYFRWGLEHTDNLNKLSVRWTFPSAGQSS